MSAAVATTGSIPVPHAKDVREVVEMLLGRDVTVGPGDPYAPRSDRPGTVAVYVDDSLRMRAVASADLTLTVYAGSALGLIPVAAAKEMLEAGVARDDVNENLGEMFNVLASIFNKPDAPHVKLYATHHVGDAVPNDVAALTRALGRRLDLAVDVAGYGSGSLSVVCSWP